MRKSISSVPDASPRSGPLSTWLDLDALASAQMTSEDPTHPLEDALQGGRNAGWKASEPGPQRITLRFDSPQLIRGVRLEFREQEVERSQEFALYVTSAGGVRKEVFRQQWTFSPGGSTREVEDLAFDLHAVSVLELSIDPGRHDKQAIATLASFEIR